MIIISILIHTLDLVASFVFCALRDRLIHILPYTLTGERISKVLTLHKSCDSTFHLSSIVCIVTRGAQCTLQYGVGKFVLKQVDFDFVCS